MENITTTENIDNSVVPTNIEAPQEAVVESSNIVDPPSKKLWEGLSKKKLYTKSFEEFEKNFSSPDKINKLWGGLSEKKLYTKSENDFQQQYFPKAPAKEYVKSDPITGFGFGLAELGKPLFVPQQLAPIVPVKIVPEEKEKEKKSSGLGLYTIPGLVQEIRESGTNNIYGFIYNKLLGGIGKAITAPADFIFNALTSSETLRGGGTKEEVLKEYRNNVLPLVNKTIKDNLGANVSLEKENKYNEGFVTGTIGGLAETVPAILTPAPARAAVLFSQGFESQLESINNTDVGKNLPESTKTIFATGTGTAMALLEKFGIEKVLGNNSSKVAQSLSIKTINELIEKAPKEITSEMFEKALNSQIVSLKDQIVEKGGKIASAALVEGITGGLQEITAITAEKITNLSTDKQVFNYESFGQSAGRVLKSTGQEALGGFTVGSVVSNMNKVDNYISDKVSNAKSIEDIDKIKSDLLLEINNGSISDVDAAKINGLIDEYSNIYSTIPEFSENRKKIAAKIKERTGIISDIQSKVETLKKVDEAFQPQMMAEIEALKGRAVEINEEINNIARNKEVEAIVEEPAVVQPVEKVAEESLIPQEVKTVEQLRTEEQAELVSKIPNAEQYKVDGKVDRTKLTNEEDIKAFDEVYDKYDKLITPLLQEGAVVSEKPVEVKPVELVEPVVISTKEEQGISYKPEQEVVIKEVETKLGGKKKAEDLFKVEARHTYGETYEDFILRKGCQ
jgi:hypothetical protein